jgi:CheY-like chemotaxis protein
MSQKLILVCDDNEDNRVVFKAILEHAGFAVVVAEDGAEALEEARAFTPSLILMDLMMPGLDGWQTVAQLKADPVTAEIPVVAVSADVHAGTEALQRGGFCAFEPKPILPKHLLDAVNRCLEELAGGGIIGWLKLPAYEAGTR